MKKSIKLGSWLKTQRQYHRKQWLSSKQSKILEELGIKWKVITFLPFEKAREFVRSLKFKNQEEWSKYDKPDNIPSAPATTYKNEWISWGDWLGTKPGWDGTYLSYKEACKFVCSLKLNSCKEWRKYCASGDKPHNIPALPNRVYKNKGWAGYGNWLGTNNTPTRNRNYWSFKKARSYIISLKLTNIYEWDFYRKSGKMPDEIPINPQCVYENTGWKGIPDWIGNGNTKDFISFEKAKQFIHSLHLKSHLDWVSWSKTKRPHHIPSSPNVIYKTQWKNWGDWLGNGNISDWNKHKFRLSFEDAKKVIRVFKLQSKSEWIIWWRKQKPNNIPSHPDRIYKKEWKGWPNFLGKSKLTTPKNNDKLQSQ